MLKFWMAIWQLYVCVYLFTVWAKLLFVPPCPQLGKEQPLKKKKKKSRILRFQISIILKIGLHKWCRGKESSCQCRKCKIRRFDPWIRKILWSRKWQPTPVFLPGKRHGQRSLVGYSSWGPKELDITEHIAHTLPWKVISFETSPSNFLLDNIH